MQFLHPQILWALLALAIPIIIHLFHFRRFKKVYFTNVRFLKEIKEEKSTTRKIRNLLVLIARLLAFSFLILAFAQPYISKNDSAKVGQNNVSIFIDNSFSMMADNKGVPLIANAKKKAEEIISAYDESDQFQILTHELNSSQQRWIEKENTIQAIDEIEMSPEVNQLSTVLSKQLDPGNIEGNHIIYILSDFQRSISDVELPGDSIQEINLIPVQSIKENNLSIDSAWFESVIPALNQNNKLLVRIDNNGDEDQEDVRLELVHNGQTRPEGTIDIKAGGSKIDTINLLVSNPGWQKMEIRIEDYPVQFDDSYFMSFNVKEKMEVLNISDSDHQKYIQSAFKGLNNFELLNSNPSSIQYDRLKDYDLIILDDIVSISSGLSSELNSYVDQGGNLIVFPNARADLDNYNAFFNKLQVNSLSEWSERIKQVQQINTVEFTFENVFSRVDNNLKLPSTRGNFNFNRSSSRPAEFLMRYRDGSDYISKYSKGKGNVFISSAPLDQEYNDLVLHAEVFVPLLYKLAYASSNAEKASYTIGKDNFTEVRSSTLNDDIVYKIRGTEEFIPGQKNVGNSSILNFNNMVDENGFYDIVLDNEHIKTIAFNYDRIESKMEFYNPDELLSKYGMNANILDNSLNTNLKYTIKEKDKGITFWKWCLILALIFLAIETGLLRFWKI